MCLYKQVVSDKSSNDGKQELSAEQIFEVVEIETTEEMQPLHDELIEIGQVYAYPIYLNDYDEETLEILEDMQLNILTEIYDELIREVEEEMMEFIEEDTLEELLDELINLAVDEINNEDGIQDEAMNIDDSESILSDYEEDEFNELGDIFILTKVDSDDDDEDDDSDDSDDDDDDENDDNDDDDNDDNDEEDSDSDSSDQDWVYEELFNNLFDINVFKKIYFGELDSDDDDSDGSDSSDGTENILPVNWEVQLHHSGTPIYCHVPSGACTCARPFHSDTVANNIHLKFGYYLDSDEEA